MPPTRSITLTEAELRLMRLLWRRGESAVSDLVQALAGERPLAYTSVLTTVRVLEKKGYVQHRQEGRAFLYSPCVAEHEASRSEVRHVLRRFFGDSRERLLLSLLGEVRIDPDELRRLKEAIAAAPDDPEGAEDKEDAAAPKPGTPKHAAGSGAEI
jgi:predicted transcriptional regulator